MTRHGKQKLAIPFFPFIFVGLAAGSPDSRLLSLVPPSAQMVAGISAPSQPGQPDNFVLMTHNNSVDLEDFFAITGGDGTQIVHQIVFVAMSDNKDQLSEHSLLADGQFDQQKLFKSATGGGATETHYRQIPVLEIQPFARERRVFNDVRWLAVLDSNVLLFGTVAIMRLELDRHLDGSSTDATLSRNLAHLRSKDETWCVLSAPTPNDEIQRALATLNPQLAELAQSGEAFEFGIHYGRRVEFEYEVTAPSAAASHAALSPLIEPPTESVERASLLPALNITGEANAFHGVVEVSTSRYKEWLSGIRHE